MKVRRLETNVNDFTAVTFSVKLTFFRGKCPLMWQSAKSMIFREFQYIFFHLWRFSDFFIQSLSSAACHTSAQSKLVICEYYLLRTCTANSCEYTTTAWLLSLRIHSQLMNDEEFATYERLRCQTQVAGLSSDQPLYMLLLQADIPVPCPAVSMLRVGRHRASLCVQARLTADKWLMAQAASLTHSYLSCALYICMIRTRKHFVSYQSYNTMKYGQCEISVNYSVHEFSTKSGIFSTPLCETLHFVQKLH